MAKIEDRSLLMYAERYSCLSGTISGGALEIVSEVFGDDFDSERHYSFTPGETEKLFSIVSPEEFEKLCTSVSEMERFLNAHGIQYRHITI